MSESRYAPTSTANFMEEKTCLITGATSGIGKATAFQLARLGATVVLVGRNQEKTVACAQEVREQTGNPRVDSLIADLSSRQAIREISDQFRNRYQNLDVLVNNVGAVMLSRQQSVDGIEMTLALNHLSYFLLTYLLMEPLASGAPSRIVNVSSDSHQGTGLDFDDLQMGRNYGGFRAYGRSKLANLLFTYELARRLEGTGVTVNGLHPGLVATNLLTNNGLRGRVYNAFFKLAGRSSQKGASTVTYLASSPDIEGVSGRYFVDAGLVPSSPESYDKESATKLWEASEELTGIVWAPPSKPGQPVPEAEGTEPADLDPLGTGSNGVNPSGIGAGDPTALDPTESTQD